MDNSLNPFFSPRGVVVIGASTSPEKLGYGVARNLMQSGYQGAIHFVSQKSGTLFERPLYMNLNDVPDPVDLAILIVPPHATPQTIEECGKRGIHAAVIVSSGFREVGAEGAALERQCLEVARRHGIRLIGPNCIGIIDTHLPLDTTFIQPPIPAAGNIGFVSHSGAFCAAIIDWARGQGFGFSRIVSLGNQADVNEIDALPAVASDEHTKVIVLYLESVADGRRFVETARAVTRQKPVIALKVGRFESGQKAAASHTGALAGSESAFEAAFEKAGILRAETSEQMFDWAEALADCPLPRGLNTLAKNARYSTTGAHHGIAILTNAGGPGVIAADSLETNGLSLAQLTESTLKRLPAILPSAASLHNPVDMLASASPETYAACLKILLADSNVDGVMVILPPPPMFTAESVAEALIPIIHASDKPVIITLMGSALTERAAEKFQRANVVTYPFPERAASAFGALVKRAEYLATQYETVGRVAAGSRYVPAELLDRQRRIETNDADALLAAYGIQTAPTRLARDEREAVKIADELGFPVVMKIASPDILHKSDVSCVLLDIKDVESLQTGYTQIVERVKALKPEARIDGVCIQRQIPQGQEIIVGAVHDEQFGPLVMFGSGGVEVEGLRDVAFALAPLNQAEAESMIRKTWAGRKLRGFRGIPPVDEEAVIDTLIKLSWLVYEHREIEEIEINPLRVLNKGAAAVDVRLKMDSVVK